MNVFHFLQETNQRNRLYKKSISVLKCYVYKSFNCLKSGRNKNIAYLNFGAYFWTFLTNG